MSDLRLALRSLAKSPGFTAVAVLMLALGIGVCTAIFTIVDAVIWRPLPYAEARRLMTGARFTEQTLREWQEAQPILDRVEAYQTRTAVMTGGAEPQYVALNAVSPGMFDLLGRAPALGRPFNAADAEPGNDRVALLSHDFWRQLGGDPGVIGRELTLDERTYSVIGVMPRGFAFPRPNVVLWTPLPRAQAEGDLRRRVEIVGRLRPGIEIAAVPEAVRALNRELDASRPQPRGWAVELYALDRLRVNSGPARMMRLFLGSVGFVLLIACTNVANLLLVRGAARQREFAVRAALGAGRGQLIRQVLAESLTLAALGAVGGLCIAQWSVQALWSLAPTEVTFLTVNEVAMDWRVLGFTVGLGGLATVLCGFIPALRAARPEAAEVLHAASRAATGSRRQQRWQQALVVAQAALAFVLLVGAGLLVRGFVQLSRVEPGFDVRNLLAASIELPAQRYPTGEQRAAFFEELRAQAATVPGVTEVTLATGIPPRSGGFHFSAALEVEGQAPATLPTGELLPFNTVADDYFRVMRIPLLRGRAFDPTDRRDGPPTIVVNDRMARRFWPGGDPIGRRIRLDPRQPWFTVVGVVGDVKALNLSDDSGSFEYYRSQRQDSYGEQATLVVRTATDSAAAIPALRQRLAALDPRLPLPKISPAGDLLAATLASARFSLLVMAFFGGMAILLAALGIYGTMAYAVAQRTREIGIRMALGAQRQDVAGLVLRQGGCLVALGLAGGIAGALALTRLLASMLFEVSPHDPATFAATTVLLAVVALLACWLPARRAMHVDPVVALRAE